jgi:hypothetical protein
VAHFHQSIVAGKEPAKRDERADQENDQDIRENFSHEKERRNEGDEFRRDAIDGFGAVCYAICVPHSFIVT